jgi:hypothetical protein
MSHPWNTKHGRFWSWRPLVQNIILVILNHHIPTLAIRKLQKRPENKLNIHARRVPESLPPSAVSEIVPVAWLLH